MTHLQKIENAMLDAQSKLYSYKMSIALFNGIKGEAAKGIIAKDRENLAEAFTTLYQHIEQAVKVAPTPTGSDNVVTLAEEWYKC